LQHKKDIVVFFHNLQNFDSKLIIKSLQGARVFKTFCVAKSSEKILCLKLNRNIKIIDSYSHLPTSLDNLASSVATDPEAEFAVTKAYFAKYNIKMKNLLRKQVMCHDYVTKETLKGPIPGKEKFGSEITGEKISDEDYDHMPYMADKMKCATLGDLMKNYCISDCTVLADCLLHNRKESLKQFGMDFMYFISGPSFFFSTAIASGKTKLGYVNDPDQYLRIQQCIRGGMTSVNTRHLKANIPEMKDYDETKKVKHLVYYDIAGLYAHTMLNKLPIDGFTALDKKALKSLNINNIVDDSEFGYFLTVDAEIPNHLHEYLRDLCPMPEKVVVNSSMVSDYQKNLLEEYKGIVSNPLKIERLVLTLQDKKSIQLILSYYRILLIIWV